MTIKEQREKLGTLAAEIRSQADKSQGRALTAEEQGAWDKVNSDYNTLQASIERQERASGLSQVVPPAGPVPGQDAAPQGRAAIANTAENRSLALAGYILARGNRPVTAAMKAAQEAMIPFAGDGSNAGEAVRFCRTPRELRFIGTQVGANGGFLMPTETMTAVEVAQLAFGSVRNAATVLSTPNGNALDWPTVDDTSNEGYMVGEGAAITESNPTFAKKSWGAYDFNSGVIKVAYQAIQDAPQNLEAMILEIAAQRVARGINRKLTVGTGASQPYGIVTASFLGKTTASATAIAADEVMDLLYSVDPAYRGQASWMMNDGIALAVRKLKGSGSGDYLWQPGLQLGQPDRLLGYPISYNNHMQATVATGTKTMLFGDMSAYKVREVAGVRVQVLVELYAANGLVGFLLTQRADGNLLDAGTHPIKHMLQA